MKKRKPNFAVRSLKASFSGKPSEPVFVVRTGSTALISAAPNFKIAGQQRLDQVVEVKQIRDSSSG